MARTSKRNTKKVERFDPRSILVDVVSTNVKKMGYHKDTMYVLYVGDKLYYFEKFDEQLYRMIRKSDSIGKALNQTGIKGKLYVA